MNFMIMVPLVGEYIAPTYISDITIEASKFHNNSANAGGVLISIDNSTITIEKSESFTTTMPPLEEY